MSNIDAIALVAFDDEPSLCTSTALDPRPSDRPRPGPSTQPVTDPIALVAFDSDPESDAATIQAETRERATLAFDLGLIDPETNSFLVLYPARTSLNALAPRTVSVPATASIAPLTVLALYKRSPIDMQPVPYLTFTPGVDLRGKQLTLRFNAPADPRSWMLEWERIQWQATSAPLPG